MTDFCKGIILGIIAVKVFESDTVQNAIHKAIRKKGKELGVKIADAIVPVNRGEDLKDEKICRRDENGKPIAGRYEYKSEKFEKDLTLMFDGYGKPHVVKTGGIVS